MHDYEILVAANDFTNSVQEGDIVVVRRTSEVFRRRGWSGEERRKFLIIPVRGLQDRDMYRLKEPLLESGKHKDEISMGQKNEETVVKPRRYQIPAEIWEKNIELDLKRVRNTTEDYQPFLFRDVVLDFSERVNICKDKYTDTFRYRE